ncbi:MAG: hypothetical protein ABIG30_00415, partial [Candidatus Aenigmatarchaeota archaeon]
NGPIFSNEVVLDKDTQFTITVPSSLAQPDTLECSGAIELVSKSEYSNVYRVKTDDQIVVTSYDTSSIYAFLCSVQFKYVDISKSDVITVKMNKYSYRVSQSVYVLISMPLGIIYEPDDDGQGGTGTGRTTNDYSAVSVPVVLKGADAGGYIYLPGANGIMPLRAHITGQAGDTMFLSVENYANSGYCKMDCKTGNSLFSAIGAGDIPGASSGDGALYKGKSRLGTPGATSNAQDDNYFTCDITNACNDLIDSQVEDYDWDISLWNAFKTGALGAAAGGSITWITGPGVLVGSGVGFAVGFIGDLELSLIPRGFMRSGDDFIIYASGIDKTKSTPEVEIGVGNTFSPHGWKACAATNWDGSPGNCAELQGHSGWGAISIFENTLVAPPVRFQVLATTNDDGTVYIVAGYKPTATADSRGYLLDCHADTPLTEDMIAAIVPMREDETFQCAIQESAYDIGLADDYEFTISKIDSANRIIYLKATVI